MAAVQGGTGGQSASEHPLEVPTPPGFCHCHPPLPVLFLFCHSIPSPPHSQKGLFPSIWAQSSLTLPGSPAHPHTVLGSCLLPGLSSPRPSRPAAHFLSVPTDTCRKLLQEDCSAAGSLGAATNCCLQERADHPLQPPCPALPSQHQAIQTSAAPPPDSSEPGPRPPATWGH